MKTSRIKRTDGEKRVVTTLRLTNKCRKDATRLALAMKPPTNLSGLFEKMVQDLKEKSA